MAASPDAGLIEFSFDYCEDLIAVHKALGTAFRGPVALHDDQVIGMVFGDLVQVQWAGQLREAVYLSNLRFLTEFQRRGVASGLADWGYPLLGFISIGCGQLGCNASVRCPTNQVRRTSQHYQRALLCAYIDDDGYALRPISVGVPDAFW